MKIDGCCYYVGFMDEPRDIDSPKCRSVQRAECLAEHYEIDEMNCDGECRDYVIRTANRRNVKRTW